MSENRIDPSANTEQFQAFVERVEPAPAKSRLPLYLVGAVVALAVVALIVVVVVLA